jgi:hypothetical protein
VDNLVRTVAKVAIVRGLDIWSPRLHSMMLKSVEPAHLSAALQRVTKSTQTTLLSGCSRPSRANDARLLASQRPRPA